MHSKIQQLLDSEIAGGNDGFLLDEVWAPCEPLRAASQEEDEEEDEEDAGPDSEVTCVPQSAAPEICVPEICVPEICQPIILEPETELTPTESASYPRVPVRTADLQSKHPSPSTVIG